MKAKVFLQERIVSSTKLNWLVMAIALFISLSLERIRLFYTAGWPDPFVYMGYAQNYSGLLEKWGPTYFASRISNIIPLYFREKIGLDFQFYRYLILLSLATAVFILLNNQQAIVRVLIPTIAVNNVWILRHVSDDYVVGLTSIYVLCSFILALRFVEGGKHGSLRLVLVGAFAGLAINANISIVLLITPWFFALAFLQRKQINVLKSLLLVCLGSLCSTILMGLFMYFRLGVAGLKSFKSQIDMIFVLRGQVGEMFSAPLVLFAPMLMLFCIVALGGWNSRDAKLDCYIPLSDTSNKNLQKRGELEIVSLCFAFSIVFGLAYHQYSPANWMSANFYIAFYIPAFLIVFALVLSKLESILNILLISVTQVALNYGLTTLKLGDFENTFSSVVRILLFGILFLFIIFAILRNQILKQFSILLMIFAAALSPLVTDNSGKFTNFNKEVSWSEYRDFARSSSSTLQEDVWKLARINNDFLKTNIPRSDVLFTIYPNNPSWLVSIDSGQLYGYSCFECTDPRGFQTKRSYPPFNKSQIEVLTKRNYIEIFSTSKDVNSEIIKSILFLDPQWNVFKEIAVSTKTSEFYAIILKKSQ